MENADNVHHNIGIHSRCWPRPFCLSKIGFELEGVEIVE